MSSKVTLNSNTSLKVSKRKDGSTKVKFSGAKDSDDEYSSVGTLTPRSAINSPNPQSTSTPVAGSIFGFLGKNQQSNVYKDSDDESSRNVTPSKGITTPALTPNRMPTVEETPLRLLNPADGANPVTPEESRELARNFRTITGKGIAIKKVCSGTVSETHDRVLFLDPQKKYLFWTDKEHLDCSEHTLKEIRNNLTASSKDKSFFSRLTGVSDSGSTKGNTAPRELTKNRNRTILISTIDHVTVGHGDFEKFITLHLKPGTASGKYKMLIFQVQDKKKYELVLRVLGTLLAPAPQSKYSVHYS